MWCDELWQMDDHKHKLKALYRQHMLGMLVPLLVTIFILLVVEIIRVVFTIAPFFFCSPSVVSCSALDKD
jgi:hypothetical protein